MMNNNHHDISVATHRLVAEEGLRTLLLKRGSSVPMETFRELIFEATPADNSAYLRAVLTALDCDVDDIDDEELRVIQDAWNYFPHRFLNGRCPAEVFDALAREGGTI
jgi:hypothetical protein